MTEKRILIVGDSKAWAGGNTWPTSLIAALNAATSPGATWAQTNLAAGAQTAASIAALIDSQLAAISDNHVEALFIEGVNDFGSPNEAAWKANVLYTADACRAKFPTIKFRIARPAKRDYDATANTFAGWIADLVAARTFIIAGPDERVWLKGADNFATMTDDGIHMNAAGQVESSNQWKSNLGY